MRLYNHDFDDMYLIMGKMPPLNHKPPDDKEFNPKHSKVFQWIMHSPYAYELAEIVLHIAKKTSMVYDGDECGDQKTYDDEYCDDEGRPYKYEGIGESDYIEITYGRYKGKGLDEIPKKCWLIEYKKLLDMFVHMPVLEGEDPYYHDEIEQLTENHVERVKKLEARAGISKKREIEEESKDYEKRKQALIHAMRIQNNVNHYIRGKYDFASYVFDKAKIAGFIKYDKESHTWRGIAEEQGR